jgi:peptide/nickel transport system ATP-binding protein
MTAPLVAASNLVRTYVTRNGLFGQTSSVTAVNGVSLTLQPGETLGIVGESGSGKSTLGRLALGLEMPDGGEVRFRGQPAPKLASAAWRAARARQQMIYQDPLGALDRRLTVLEQVREPLDIHCIGARRERAAMALDMLARTGLSRDHAARYPHELSGGQRQRVVLARALMTRPEFLVCDEPVSALDVSIQAQVVNLLIDLQAELGVAMLFISHDLRVVRQISHRIAVMYLGQLVEEGDADDLFAVPLHPYTRALVSAAPSPTEAGRRERLVLKGEPPNPADRASGCAFHPRCPVAIARCRIDAPVLEPAGGARRVACHLARSAATSNRQVA